MKGGKRIEEFAIRGAAKGPAKTARKKKRLKTAPAEKL
jgi:hypothetical protein